MFEWIAGARDLLWVPKWSSTAVTCDVADIGSPTLSRGHPLQICPCGRARPRHLAESITTVITDAITTYYRGIHHGSATVSHRTSLTFSALTCWFWTSPSGSASPAWHHGRRLVSVAEAATGRQPPP